MFNMKSKITIILKSGAQFSFKCDNFKINHKANEIMSYTIEGGDGTVFHIVIDEIAAILRE